MLKSFITKVSRLLSFQEEKEKKLEFFKKAYLVIKELQKKELRLIYHSSLEKILHKENSLSLKSDSHDNYFIFFDIREDENLLKTLWLSKAIIETKDYQIALILNKAFAEILVIKKKEKKVILKAQFLTDAKSLTATRLDLKTFVSVSHKENENKDEVALAYKVLLSLGQSLGGLEESYKAESQKNRAAFIDSNNYK